MSEQAWQVTVLTELGVPLSGLTVSDPSGRPLPSPVAQSAQGQVPTGGIPEVSSSLPSAEEWRPAEDVSVIGGSPIPQAERTTADPFADQPDDADQPVIVDQPVIGGAVQDGRAVPFGGATDEPTGPTNIPQEASDAWPSAAPAPPEQPSWDQGAPAQAAPEPPVRWEQDPRWEQATPPAAEQGPPPSWNQGAPPQAQQQPSSASSDLGAPPQAEQSPSAWTQVPPSHWEQAPQQADSAPPAWEQQATPPVWDQAPPQQAPGGQSSSDQAPPSTGEQNAAPPWEQGVPPQSDQVAAPQEEQGPSLSPWDPPPQAQWEQAAQASWGAQAGAPQEASEPPEQEAWPSGSDAWQQEADASPQQPVQGSPESGPPPVSGPPQVGPPMTGGPIAARDLVRRSAYGDPLVRRMSRGVRRAVGAAAANDVRQAADVEAVLNRPVPSCRQIAVTSIRGGAGKTTVAGLTATVIAQYRQDRVLAIDADSGLGSLPLRMGVGPHRSLHDLTSAQPRSFDEVSRYLAQTTDGLWVLSGTAGGRIAGELDLGTFRAAAGAMSRYFAATVIDCGAGLLPELQRGIMADAHAQVMVTPGTVDGALSAHGALDWQARNGFDHLLPRTVIAFVTHTPHVDADLSRAAQMLSSGGLPVVHIPYDRHLAAGTSVESARIGHETRAAVIRIAVEAFARAVAA
ncbi:MAG: hypothetical protein ACJ72W_28265 [Actinoallomurus sp.]